MKQMTASERLELCDRVTGDKRSFGLSLDDVRRIDDWLRNTWHISPPLPLSEIDHAVERATSRSVYRKYQKLHNEQADYLSAGEPIPEAIETAFYDIIADPRLSGIIHSQKRTMILDSGCLLVHLVRALAISGPAIDIGCHVGYHAALLTSETAIPVHGVDRSSRAIAIAKTRTPPQSRLTFDTASLESPQFQEAFELVYAVRSLPLTPDAVAEAARLLKPGGIAVIFPPEPPDDDHSTITAINDYGLGFAFGDIVGGWLGEGRGFGAGLVTAFVKGANRPMPLDALARAQDAWGNHFKDYANSPQTPEEEKTQAYCRGHWQAVNNA